MDSSETISSPLHSIENVSQKHEKLRSKKLVADAKVYASEGELHKSLEYFKKAYKLYPTEKILSRIKRIKEAIAEAEEDEEEEDFGFTELDNGLVIYKQLVERLYPHQIDGVKWMYNLYKKKKRGGILADDMGLGKTIQIIAFISAMFDMRLIKHILLVLPLSVIPNWVQEFKAWAPGIRIECFHGAVNKRRAVLQKCMTRRSVCITTYGLIVTQYQALGETANGQDFIWDYIILDEGHRIKNSSKTTKRLHLIPSKHRLILTGTPVQNKVRDLWALMDWVMQGTLLGTQKTFKSEYEHPIERARQRDASAVEIQFGNHMAESLRRLTNPYVLRRTKDKILTENKENTPFSNESKQVDDGQDMTVLQNQPSFPKLSTKNDFVCWVYLSEIQQTIYRDFLQLDSVKALLSSHRSPLVYLTVLKKICDHPRLLSTRACLELGLQSNNLEPEDMNSSAIEDCAANRIDNIPDQTLLQESGKLQFLIQLLIQLRGEGHRTLVFSMSRKMLNIIQRILMNEKFKIMRLDGLVTKISERERRVNRFQEDPSYHVFLLTTQVGGVGLTLTAADRVVIYDPSWNPATDAQAVDRLYRIGQKKSVVVYRLITCGSVEEKIYRRQIFKNSVIQQSTGESKDPYRYFTRQDLTELFILDDVLSSATQKQLEELHGHQRKLSKELQEHVKYLHTLKMFGTSDHDLMFSRKPDDFDYDHQMATNNFDNKVEEAQNRLRLESDQFIGQNDPLRRWGAFVESREKEISPNRNDNEPIYPIEGLSDKIQALNLPTEDESKAEQVEVPSSLEKHLDDDLPGINIKIEPSEAFLSGTPTKPSKNDQDDDVIICLDSPTPVKPGYFKFTPAENRAKLPSLDSDDNIILAADSPGTKQSGDSVDPEKRKDEDIPIEIEDSFDMFSNINDEDKTFDESWKEAFGVETSATPSSQKPNYLEKSWAESPLFAPQRKRVAVIHSDVEDSPDANYSSSSDNERSKGFLSKLKPGRRSVCAGDYVGVTSGNTSQTVGQTSRDHRISDSDGDDVIDPEDAINDKVDSDDESSFRLHYSSGDDNEGGSSESGISCQTPNERRTGYIPDQDDDVNDAGFDDDAADFNSDKRNSLDGDELSERFNKSNETSVQSADNKSLDQSDVTNEDRYSESEKANSFDEGTDEYELAEEYQDGSDFDEP